MMHVAVLLATAAASAAAAAAATSTPLLDLAERQRAAQTVYHAETVAARERSEQRRQRFRATLYEPGVELHVPQIHHVAIDEVSQIPQGVV